MRITYILMTLLALGCSDATPKLVFSKLGINEESVPLAFATAVTNEGGASAAVESADTAESGCSVVEEETESSMSVSEGEPEGAGEVECCAGEPEESVERFLERSFCAMRVSEKGRLAGGRGTENSETVLRIAVVISSREV